MLFPVRDSPDAIAKVGSPSSPGLKVHQYNTREILICSGSGEPKSNVFSQAHPAQKMTETQTQHGVITASVVVDFVLDPENTDALIFGLRFFLRDETPIHFVFSYESLFYKEETKERQPMQLAAIRSSVYLSTGILGTLLIGAGFFYPVYAISPPENTTFPNPYPPVVNGWEAIRSRLSSGPLLVLILVTAVLLFSACLLLLLQKYARIVSTVRLLLSFVCIALLVFFILDSIFMNFADSPDGAAASPTFTVGEGFWMVLAGLALGGVGAGSASIGAFIGTCLGIVIGYFLTLGIGALLNFLPQADIPGIGALFFIGMTFWFGMPLLGSILGGWLFRKIQIIDDDLSSDRGTTQRTGV